MDSAHFRRLCFLLLNITAPHANIAMPSGNPAEMTQASSSDKIHVTVYYCKDCEISVCKAGSTEGFEKIGETHNKRFSNKVIELEINETNINMCFQQENTFYKGIYSIWWLKNVGIGHSCGIADYGENRGGNSAKICCAAEINHKEPRHSLECYVSGEHPPTRKPTDQPVNITDEGYPGIAQPLVGLQGSTGIVAGVLILGAFAAALITFCVRRNKNSQGLPMLIQQFFLAAGDKNPSPDMEEKFAPLKKNSK